MIWRVKSPTLPSQPRKATCFDSYHVYVRFSCHDSVHALHSQEGYKCVNEDSREGIGLAFRNPRFLAVKTARTAQGIILITHYSNALTWPDHHDCSPCFNDSTRPAHPFPHRCLSRQFVHVSRRPKGYRMVPERFPIRFLALSPSRQILVTSWPLRIHQPPYHSKQHCANTVWQLCQMWPTTERHEQRLGYVSLFS
jgi:hypothetical protein